MLVTNKNASELAWQKMDNLIPAIIQHAKTGAVLMQGFVNLEALQVSLESKKATFYSRSKERLWTKGESSENFLHVEQIITDCDKDSLLFLCLPDGPTCHLGTESCFPEQPLTTQNFVSQLEHVINQRANESEEVSYTARLLNKTVNKVAQKVGEEGVEVALAGVAETDEELLGECADLFYHTLVLLKKRGLSLQDVNQVLIDRHQK